MDQFSIAKYSPQFKSRWNEFVASSRNATFLLNRDYMDYHKHRFTDASLIICDSRGKTMALFAASAHGSEIRAHGGLTYGGFILPMSGIDAANLLTIFDLIRNFYLKEGFNLLLYKAIPHIYHILPSEEDLYVMFRNKATIAEVNVSSTIELGSMPRFNENSRRHVKKALSALTYTCETNDWDSFWDILTDVLQSRHSTTPVHSLAEIKNLANKFPNNIKLIAAYSPGKKMLGGTVLYISSNTIHAQYIAASEEGRKIGVLPLLFQNIAQQFKSTHKFLDFGTCNENNGEILNQGLLRQKNGMGGRATVYTIYSISL